MIYYIKKTIKYFKLVVLLIFLLLVNSYPLQVSGRMYNQYKVQELTKMLGSKEVSLILLTVTGDQRYKNSEISKIYKELQIIHVLVISGSNILIVHHFIHLFIYRKNKTNYLISIIFIYFYGLFISMPETLIRALISLIIIGLINLSGIKINKFKYLLLTLFLFLIIYFWLNLSNSYILSVIYSSVITFHTGICIRRCNSNWISFLTLNALLTLTSSIIFQFSSFSIICTSFIANIFITLVYDIAIYLAYILYLLPVQIVPLELQIGIRYFFQVLFLVLNFTKQLTYNVCYE